jgi:hypothetical protein
VVEKAQEELLVAQAREALVAEVKERGPLRPAELVRALEKTHKAYAVRYAYWELRTDHALIQDQEGLLHLGT